MAPEAAEATTFDLVIIGAGAGGESAAYEARELGLRVAIVDRRWYGGSCPHIACVPSKALLHAAAEHKADPDGYPWSRASERRDWMVNRAPGAPWPDDSGHRTRLEDAGVVVQPGVATIVARGEVEVAHDGATHRLVAREVVVAVGSFSTVPDIPGLAEASPWTNEQATLARELPRSLVVLGGGPSGCELAQVYARFGVPTSLVHSHQLLAAQMHPRNAEVLRTALERDGVTVRTGVRAVGVRAGAGADGGHILDLHDGSSVEGHEILLAVGRTMPIRGLGLEHYGIDATARDAYPRDGRMRVAEGLLMVGDVAGPEMHTHLAHYQGELAARLAAGQEVEPDYRALPRAMYTDPELAFVGVTVEDARAAGLDAFELTADFATSTRGYGIEADLGHVTIIVDRAGRQLVGAAMACPDASAAIHECVLAIKARVPIDVLAETIHAFPSTSRSLNGLFADARKELDKPSGVPA
jgi:pyruvate/2-oxoglutarate dehydrogenase complex dihydrolipoamide dehydrogenase (E3) component